MSQLQKYDRQKLIPGWDQDKLTRAKVAVVGAGALGNHVCLGLIGLGIGTIKIYDYDEIQLHNLNRQSLFTEEDVGKNKAEVLAERLKERNSSITIIGINEKIEEETIDMVIRDVDVIVDCVDRIYVRRVLSRYCLWNDIPLVHGGISWFGGETGILTRETPCINCIYPDEIQKRELEIEASCIDNPNPSVVYTSQIVAGLMVNNVRRVLLPLESDYIPPVSPSLLKIDLRLSNPFYFEKITRKKDCECVEILREVAPEILEREKKMKEKEIASDSEEIARLLNDS